jgi:hypothetical protein
MISICGVLYLECNLPNISVIIPERSIENSKRFELIKNLFKPVNIAIIIAIANNAKLYSQMHFELLPC